MKGRLRGAGRILVMIENVPLAHDHRARKQVETLLEAGYQVSVISPRHPDNASCLEGADLHLYEYPPPRESGTKLSFVYEYAYSWLASAYLTVKAFNNGGFEAIQAGSPPDTHFLIAWPFKLAGRSFVVDQRDLSPEVYAVRYGRMAGAVPWLLRTLEKMSWRSADQILCVNGSLREVILRRGKVSPESVTVVGNGPVVARTNRRQARPDFKQGKRFLACWVGLMGPQDRIDLALEAVHHLVHTRGRRDCHFAFIGEGEALPQLQRLSKRLDITDWVTFTGWLDEDDCFEYLATAHVALDSNVQEEVSPVKCMEYMAFGVPFVAFDLVETRAMAEGAALYVAPGDSAALGTAIDVLLDQPEERAAMSSVGLRRLRETLSWDRQKPSYLRAIARVSEARKANRLGLR